MLVAGAWRKRQRKRAAFSEPSGCKDWGKKATKKHTAKVCLSVVLVAGLEPARCLHRGILRYLRVDFQENFTKEEKCKNGAVLHEKPSKMPQNKQFLQKNNPCSDSLKIARFPEVPNNYAGIKNENFEELFFAKVLLY